MKATGKSNEATSGDAETRPRKKPGRAPVSCAECRRLKLRCDRKIPCGKCVQRGCGAICPDGSLTTGKGNRLILANTSELHDRIETLCLRVRTLEEALRIMQANISSDPHPLLSDELLSLKIGRNDSIPMEGVNSTPETDDTGHTNSISVNSNASVAAAVNRQEEEEVVFDSFGTLTIGLYGEAKFLGQTARADLLLHESDSETDEDSSSIDTDSPSTPPYPYNYPYHQSSHQVTHSPFQQKHHSMNYAQSSHTPRSKTKTTLPKELMAHYWPESPPVPPESLREMVYDYLPSLEDACTLCEIYLGQSSWMGSIVSKQELYDDLIGAVYRPATIEAVVCPHKLSLLFSIFALGSLFDLTKPPYAKEAEMYYQLSKVAITFKSPVSETTLATVQSICNMVRYLDFCDWGLRGNGETQSEKWVIMGVLVKLATSMGLHYDSSRWKLDLKLTKRRHVTFWQIYVMDIRESLIYGRPPCISDVFIDCPLPKDLDSEHATHTLWNINFFRLVRRITEEAFGTCVPSYNAILAMDVKLREFPIPPELTLEYTDEQAGSDPEKILQKWCVLQMKESVLLTLHRTSFARASELFPQTMLNCKYGPSVLACYRSAYRLIESVEWVYKHVPGLAPRIVCYYAGAAFSAIVMCLLIIRAPTSSLAPAAMGKLDIICDILETISDSSRVAKRNLRAVEKMRQKARETLTRAFNNDASEDDEYNNNNSNNNITSTSAHRNTHPISSSDQTDELHRLGGKTRLIPKKYKKEPRIAIITPTESSSPYPQHSHSHSHIHPITHPNSHVLPYSNNSNPNTIHTGNKWRDEDMAAVDGLFNDELGIGLGTTYASAARMQTTSNVRSSPIVSTSTSTSNNNNIDAGVGANTHSHATTTYMEAESYYPSSQDTAVAVAPSPAGYNNFNDPATNFNLMLDPTWQSFIQQLGF